MSTKLTPEMLDVIRELRGLVDVPARLRFCVQVLRDVEATPNTDPRVTLVRTVLFTLVGELAAAEVRIATAPVERATTVLRQIQSLAAAGRPFTRRSDRLFRIVLLAREARRILREVA